MITYTRKNTSTPKELGATPIKKPNVRVNATSRNSRYSQVKMKVKAYIDTIDKTTSTMNSDAKVFKHGSMTKNSQIAVAAKY